MNAGYAPQRFESRWQRIWEELGLHKTGQAPGRPKFYCLNYFPYPSGEGLHVGHCRNYIPTDVLARFKRMRGENVLFPMGWDAFGEPTEQHAIAHGVHPRRVTDRATANFRRQLGRIGTSFDWDREIDSSKPEFYRWTQWFFLLLYRRGLAYRDTNWQWWCPTCQTTLSSHEATGGVCWRGHPGVSRREIPAWYFRITAYADELLEGLEDIAWPEPIKAMQRNWIGRSTGWEIEFQTQAGASLPAFTTRPDTLHGVTFLALAPEHPLVETLTSPGRRSAVAHYLSQAQARSEIERAAQSQPKSGVFTGARAVNPANGEPVPVWVADYVLPGYASGVVMGVPAHDERDFAFAQANGLPVRTVVANPEGSPIIPDQAYTGPGTLVNSGPFNGAPAEQGGRRIAEALMSKGLARKTVMYRMRDWLISRQRYWGTPIPILYCEACGELPVPEEDLPVLLPPMEDFAPDGSGRSPLARVPGFVSTTCPQCDGPARRETDTMGGFACSSWYFLRFTSPRYDLGPFEPEAMRYWMPVDLYVGGAEHAVLHLLYARFWTRVMHEAGLVPFKEPFPRLMNQGVLHAPDGQRMSKSRGNVITPDAVVEQYGADALRVYALFIAPFDQDVVWDTEGIQGVWRFLGRVWSLYDDYRLTDQSDPAADPETARHLHRAIREITARMEELRFNTLISELMTLVNHLTARKREGSWRSPAFHKALKTLLVLLAPIAPHLASELWQSSGQPGSVHSQPWPSWDPALARAETYDLPIQVDGKAREVVSIARTASQDEVEVRALASESIQRHLGGREVVRVVYVPGRVLNFVTRPRGSSGDLSEEPHQG